ncbi:class IV adenylate cyclase [Candidatus Omnitrophota bacterium]
MKYGFKKVSKRFKVMNEIEVPTDDFHNLKFILEKLGYRVDGFKEKRRHTYHLNKVNVLIDRLPFLGNWMELEGRSRHIEKAARRLKLKMRDSNNLSYGQLFSRFLKEHSGRLKRYKKRVDIFSFDCEKRSGLTP